MIWNRNLIIMVRIFFFFLKGDFFNFFQYFIQHGFICRPSDSTLSETAGIEPRTVATSALAVGRSNHTARSHPELVYTYDWYNCCISCISDQLFFFFLMFGFYVKAERCVWRWVTTRSWSFLLLSFIYVCASLYTLCNPVRPWVILSCPILSWSVRV